MGDVLAHRVIFPAVPALVGFGLVPNLKGAADLLYVRIERVLHDLAGGIGPRTVRVLGTAMFAFGLLGTVVDGWEAPGPR